MAQLLGSSKLLGEALSAKRLGCAGFALQAIRREHDLLQYLGLLPDLGIATLPSLLEFNGGEVCRQVIIIILVKSLFRCLLERAPRIESTLEAPEEGPIEQEMVEIGGSQRAGGGLRSPRAMT